MARADDLVAVEPRHPAQGVDRHHRLDERLAAGEVVGGAHGGGDRDALDLLDLAGQQRSAVDAHPGLAALRAAGDQHLRRSVRRSARRTEQFGGRVAAQRPAPPHHEVRGDRQHRQVDLDVGRDVDVVEQPPEPRAPQLHRGDGSTGDGRGATEGSDAHGRLDDLRPGSGSTIAAGATSALSAQRSGSCGSDLQPRTVRPTRWNSLRSE